MDSTATPSDEADRPDSVEMKTPLEIHMPGLDLDTKRWNYHTIFMTEVHANLARVGARAYEEYRRSGRGAFFADAEQWLLIVKRQFNAVKEPFPLSYFPAERVRQEVDFGPLQQGFANLLDTYDAEREFNLVVNHHPGDVLSCYLIAPEPGPARLHERFYELREALPAAE